MKSTMLRARADALRLISVTLVLSLSLIACSTTPFPYKRYALQQDGTLLGAKVDGSDDHKLSECATKNGGSQCFVFFSSEYQKMREDYSAAQIKLGRCK